MSNQLIDPLAVISFFFGSVLQASTVLYSNIFLALIADLYAAYIWTNLSRETYSQVNILFSYEMRAQLPSKDDEETTT